MLRACALVALIGGVLPGAGGASAAGPSTERVAPPDAPTAAEVAFHLRYDAPSPGAPSRDRWIAQDKATHVVVSGLWTLSAQYVLVNKAGWSEDNALPLSAASAAVVGGAKELYDATRPAGTASGKDLVADAVGIGLAVGVIVL